MSSSRPSRSLRKRQPAKLADDLDYDLESLLKEHERDGVEYRARRDAKKLKVAALVAAKSEEDARYADAFKGYDIPLDTLPALCIERIYAMLDSPEDFFNLAFTSKFLMSLVTPEAVIRSAVFNNLRRREKGKRKTMSNIMNYINNRSIHIPSAHRMLRLLNAKTCERGDKCWGKNLNTGKAMGLGPTTRAFGLALCDKCIKFGTTKVPYSHPARFQQGVAFHEWNLLTDPHRDPKSGDVSGPLLEVLKLQQIENTYGNNDDKKVALQGIVEKAIYYDGKCCPHHYDVKAAAYYEMFKNAEKEADEYVAAELERERQKYRERRYERIAKRMTRIKSIYASLEEILDDCPLKDLALDCRWLENDERCIKFTCHIVEQLLSHIISAPASASERSINSVATSIKRIFNTLHEKEFFSYTFLENSPYRFKGGMLEYCRNESSPLLIMQSSVAGDAQFLRAVEEDRPARALARAFCRMRGALSRIFALSVVRENPDSEDEIDNRVEDFRKLAEVVWNKKAPNVMTLLDINETFNCSRKEFRMMKRNVKDYLRHEDTRSFLQRDDAGRGDDDFSREDAIDQVFVPKTHTHTRSSPYEHIRSRNFESLRSLHEQYFQRPYLYGVHAL